MSYIQALFKNFEGNKTVKAFMITSKRKIKFTDSQMFW